jgi:hypothetical protein
VARQVHCVVQHSQHQNPIVVEFVDQKVTGIADQAASAFRSRAAMAEVVSACLGSQFRPIHTAEAASVDLQVIKREINDRLISASRPDTEHFLAVTKDRREIPLGQQSQNKCAQSLG